MDDKNFRVVSLHVKGINIDNLSLTDVGDYLADFAKLLGVDVMPRFDSIKRTGSFSLKARVPREKEIDVKTRGFLLRTGDAPEDAILARDRIARRLGVHRAKSATLLDSQQSKVIEIPVVKPSPSAPSVPSLNRAGTLQGKIVRIGGKQDTVSVELQDIDGLVYLCKASREVAKKLAREMFDATVRVHGHGRWTRDDDGIWRVDEFHISPAFEILEDDSLIDVLKDLRSIQSAWKKLDDPDAEINLNWNLWSQPQGRKHPLTHPRTVNPTTFKHQESFQ